MSQFFTHQLIYTKIPAITFNTPIADGSYLLKAKSGLSFDNSTENSEAAFENSKILLSNIIGIFSSKLKAIVERKDGKCGAEIGAFLYNGTSGTVSIAKSLKEYSGTSKSQFKLTKDVFYCVKDKM